MDIYMNMQITTTEDDEEIENLSDEESDSDDCLERFNFSNLCYNYFWKHTRPSFQKFWTFEDIIIEDDQID